MMYEKVQCEYLFELIRSGMFDGEPFENGENCIRSAGRIKSKVFYAAEFIKCLKRKDHRKKW